MGFRYETEARLTRVWFNYEVHFEFLGSDGARSEITISSLMWVSGLPGFAGCLIDAEEVCREDRNKLIKLTTTELSVIESVSDRLTLTFDGGGLIEIPTDPFCEAWHIKSDDHRINDASATDSSSADSDASSVRVSEEERVFLSEQRIISGDFSAKKFARFASEGSRFEECNFDGTMIESAAFGLGTVVSEYLRCSFNHAQITISYGGQNAHFIGCSFDNAQLSMLQGGNTRFVRCSFENTSIQNWFGIMAEFVDCTFSGLIRDTLFLGAVSSRQRELLHRERNQIEGNDFSRAQFHNVAFRDGVDLSKQRLPTGKEYFYFDNAAAAVDRAQTVYNSWRDSERKVAARRALQIMIRNAKNGQKQLHIRPDDFYVHCRPAIRSLLEAIGTF